MTRYSPFYFLLFLLPLCVSAQDEAFEHKCAVAEHDTRMSQRFADWREGRNLLEQQIGQYQSKNQGAKTTAEIVRIPVTVHVVHNNSSNFIGGASNPNISKEQILSQIDVLNEDYRRKSGTAGFNTNAVGADMEIEFFMATTDPNGNPTDGITRHFVDKAEFDPYNDGDLELANIVSWNPDRYLNIWVVPKLTGTIGFSQFPYSTTVQGMNLVSLINKAKTDGIYVPHRYYGRNIGTAISGLYKEGRVATHEIGHWLGLLHTWGDTFCGTDYCNDTPNCEKGNLTDNCNAVTSNCSNIRTQNMIENYMDYSPDKCMNIFTNDQKNRTRAVLASSTRRKNLVAYWNKPLPQPEVLTVNIAPNPATNPTFLQIYFKGTAAMSVEVFDMVGNSLLKNEYTNAISVEMPFQIDNLGSGMYLMKVTAGEQAVTKRFMVLK